MAQCCYSCVETKSLSQDVLDVFRFNGVELGVVCALGNENDGSSLANFAVLGRN